MPNGKCHIRGFLRHVHVQNGRGIVKPLKPVFYKRYVDDTMLKENVTKQILF